MEKVSLIDRTREKRAMRLLLKAAEDGFSGSLVLRGEPGIGKTALLEYAIAQASGMQVARLTAVESEMEVGYAALHQLLIPFLPEMDVLPAPQREALRSALGLTTAEAGPPDRFLVGLATLTLLAALASRQPLLVAVDDGQWLDQASAEVLAFVARRVYADSIVLLFAVREPLGRRLPLDGLNELHLTGLSERGARALLATVIDGPLDDDTAAWLIAGANGNPLALLELPGELREGRLDGRPRLPAQFPVGALLRQRFLRQVNALPADTRTVLLLAAAEPAGDPALLWRSASSLGLTPEAAAPAEAERLLTVLPRVSFRHPLIRSAVYYGASDSQRRQAHQALAAASDPELDPQRRSWHLAAAAPGPDERVAAELERSAERAAKRGGYVATAAFLARAAEMTPDRGRQAARGLAAAQADLDAGNPAQALTLLERAAPALGSPLERATAERLYGGLNVALGRGRGTVQILLESARTLLPLDSRLGRDTLLEAMEAAIFFQPNGGRDQETAEVGRAVPVAAALDGGQTVADLLLDGLAVRFTDAYQAAVPYLRRAIKALRASTDIRWFGLGCLVAVDLWDLSAWHALASHWTALARQRGALTPLQVALQLLAGAEQNLGRLDVCQALMEETAEIAAATGNPGLIGTDTRGHDVMAALHGQEAETRERVAAGEREWRERGGGGGDMGAYALTVLEIGLGRHHDALPHALRIYHDDPLFLGAIALPDVVEAAVRSGEREAAAAALDRLTQRAGASGTPWALGLLARSEALMATDGDAEERYRDAFGHLGESLAMPDLARARLLYGEWLRQQGRRAEARQELRTARDMFSSMELAAFAGRAQAGLTALGARRGMRRQGSGSATGEALTAQEERIARLVAEGASNSEAGAALFLSPSTIDYHLRKVFRKLGITSRIQLVRALRDAGLSELGI